MDKRVQNGAADDPQADARENRRRFLKKAGTIAIAAPVIETLSREGLLVRAAHAQTDAFNGLGGPMNGEIIQVA